MGSKGLSLLLDASRIPYILHVAHSGAAATAAAAAAASLLLPSSPAHCEAPSGGWYAGVPEPFPSAVFQGDENDRSFILNKEFHESGTVISTIADGLGGQSYSKTYPRELKGFWSTFSPLNLILVVIKCVALNMSPLVSEYFLKVDELEEEAFNAGLDRPEAWPPLPLVDLFTASKRAGIMILRDILTVSVRRVYERAASVYCSPRTTWKLLKDIRMSAIRKQSLPWYVRLVRVGRTHLRATALTLLADCTVGIAIETTIAISRAKAKQEYRGLGRKIGRIVTATVIRCSSCLVVGSAGAGVGALLFSPINRPGAGAYLGGSGVEIAFSILVLSPMLHVWVYGDESLSKAPAGQDGGNGGNEHSDAASSASESASDDAPDLTEMAELSMPAFLSNSTAAEDNSQQSLLPAA